MLDKLPLLLERHLQTSIGNMGELCYKSLQVIHFHYPSFHLILNPSLFGLFRSQKLPSCRSHWGYFLPCRLL